MKKLLLPLLLGAAMLHAQRPQVPFTGNVGSGGLYPFVNPVTISFSSDADYVMSYPETSGVVIKVTSTVSLSATRNLVAPAGFYFFIVKNSTLGNKAIQFIGPSGVGVTIPNGQAVTVVGDGSSYVSSGSSGGSSFITSFTANNNYGLAVVSSGALNVPHYTGVTAPRTPGDCPEFDTNGIDLIDAGAPCGSGGGGSPGGSATNIQTNGGSGSFHGDGNFIYDPSNNYVGITGQNGLFSGQVLSSPGWNYGSPGTGTSTGALITSTYDINANIYGQGNHSILNGNGIVVGGNGDLNFLVNNGLYYANNIDGSAQGYTGIADQTIIAPTSVYEANVFSTGTPSGYPGVMLLTTGSSGNWGVGRWLIDKTTSISFTATGSTQQGSGTNVYAAVTETGQTFAVSKRGSLSAAVNGPTVPNPNNLPILATFHVTIGSSCSVGDQFTIGGVNVESAKIVSASYTGGVMTATAWLRSSHEAGAFFMCEGPTGELVEQVQDRTSGNRFLFIVLGAINSTTLAIAREIPNGMDAGFIGAGSDVLYQGARIVDARDPFTGALNGNMTLAETTATFTASDAVEVPNGTTQILTGRLILSLRSFNPYLSGGTVIGLGCPAGSTECGSLLDGQAIIGFGNGNPCSFYTICGGRMHLRDWMRLSGTVGRFAHYYNLPVAAMFEYDQTAGASWNLWQGDDADFYENLYNSGTATTVLTHANNFIFAGPSASNTNVAVTGNVSSSTFSGPTTAPSGSCTTSGQWVFSQDGHATFCASGTWVVKI